MLHGCWLMAVIASHTLAQRTPEYILLNYVPNVGTVPAAKHKFFFMLCFKTKLPQYLSKLQKVPVFDTVNLFMCVQNHITHLAADPAALTSLPGIGRPPNLHRGRPGSTDVTTRHWQAA